VKNHVRGAFIATAVAGLFIAQGAIAQEQSAKTPANKTVHCEGVNACKGQGACGGADHDCAGKNACKGKGWLSMSAKECKAKGGTFKE
jgi:hypothetical protein